MTAQETINVLQRVIERYPAAAHEKVFVGERYVRIGKMEVYDLVG